MKMLSLAISLLLSAPVFAGDQTKALEAATEAEFLAKAGPEWTRVDRGHYEATDNSGKRVTVGFGPEAMRADIDSLTALADAQQARLEKSATVHEKAQLRHSIAQTLAAIASIEHSVSEHTKAETSGFANLRGCNNNIAITPSFGVNLAMISNGGVTVEAWGPSFAYGGGPAVGTVTLTAIANGLVNSASRVMYPTYIGDYLSTSSQFFDWGCTLEARASIVPACPTAGYRSVKWVTDCTAIVNGQAPTPVFSGYRNR